MLHGEISHCERDEFSTLPTFGDVRRYSSASMGDCLIALAV
jgi:hypothetical protein